jgi:hypothetical protein
MGELPSNGVVHDSATEPLPATAETTGADGADFGRAGVPLTSPVITPLPIAFTANIR